MLINLSIHNYVLIDALVIDFDGGMISITGETGAGKSIILGALKLVLGERVDPKFLKDPTQKCIIEAKFSLNKERFNDFFNENDLDLESETIIRREILVSGKSRAFINDTPVTLDILNKLTSRLIDIHSQFETSELLKEEYQLQLLDNFSSNENLLKEYKEEFLKYYNKNKELKELENKLSEGNKDLDYKLYLLSELETIEEDLDFKELSEELLEIENSVFILQSLSESTQIIDNEDLGILNQFSELENKFNKLGIYSSDLLKLSERITNIKIEIKDISEDINVYLDNSEFNQDKLDKLQEQVNKINALLVKHRVQDISELYKIKRDLQSETSDFSNIEENIGKLKTEISKIEIELEKQSKKLNKNRKDQIPFLEEKILNILSRLGMEKAILKIEISSLKDFSVTGKDKIQFLFSANKGAQLKSIAKAISGGERSRVMLAIKNIISITGILPTLILDEIDTGVSGRIADEMGKLMQEMSESMQLIVITHLPQVAAKGNEQYKVEKQEINEKTITSMRKLSKKERVEEIAQLISGSEITEAARTQAKSFLS